MREPRCRQVLWKARTWPAWSRSTITPSPATDQVNQSPGLGMAQPGPAKHHVLGVVHWLAIDGNDPIMKLNPRLFARTALQDARVASSERAQAMQVAVANALNSASERIESVTRSLNQSRGENVGIG